MITGHMPHLPLKRIRIGLIYHLICIQNPVRARNGHAPQIGRNGAITKAAARSFMSTTPSPSTWTATASKPPPPPVFPAACSTTTATASAPPAAGWRPTTGCWPWIWTATAASATAASCSATTPCSPTAARPQTAMPRWRNTMPTKTALSIRKMPFSSACAFGAI